MHKKTMKDLITGVKLFNVRNPTINIKKQKPPSKFFVNEKITIERHIFTESRLINFSRKEKRHFMPEKTVDLHGLTRDEAFERLLLFFMQCQKSGVRKALVITGGNNLRNSTLRAAFQKWIRDDFGNFVIKCTVSEIFHGGEGAFYVLIKKKAN